MEASEKEWMDASEDCLKADIFRLSWKQSPILRFIMAIWTNTGTSAKHLSGTLREFVPGLLPTPTAPNFALE